MRVIVKRNGSIVCTAGIEDFGTLIAAVRLVKPAPESAVNAHFVVDGLLHREGAESREVRWFADQLRDGDEIIMTMSIDASISEPLHVRPDPFRGGPAVN